MKRLFLVFLAFQICLAATAQDTTIHVMDTLQVTDTAYAPPYLLGEDTFYISATCFNECDSSIAFINLHDDENTSVEAAEWFLQDNSGLLVQLIHTGKRYLQFNLQNRAYAVDPNRMYSMLGIKASLMKQGSYTLAAAKAVKEFSDTLLHQYIDGKKLVVALHNNTEGALSILSYKKGATEGKNGAKIYVNKSTDPDDFILTTEEEVFTRLRDKKINVVLQAKNATDDGSLSIYAKNKRIPYINVEAQHGHLDQQYEMLQALKEIIEYYSPRAIVE